MPFSSLLNDFPWLINAYNPKITTIKREREHVFENIDPWSFTLNEVWMYCTFFGLQQIYCDSTPLSFMLVHLVQSQCTVNIGALRHRDDHIPVADRNTLSPSSLFNNSSTGGLIKSTPSLHLCHLLQKSNTRSWMYLLPLFHIHPLYFSSWSMGIKLCLVPGAWREQSKHQVTGEAAPLVLIIPVNPLHCCHYTSVSSGSSLCRRKSPQFLHHPYIHPWGLQIMKGTWGRQTERGIDNDITTCTVNVMQKEMQMWCVQKEIS